MQNSLKYRQLVSLRLKVSKVSWHMRILASHEVRSCKTIKAMCLKGAASSDKYYSLPM